LSSTLPDRPIEIGVLYSSTGITASTEKLLLSAAQFAVSEINNAGGVNGRPLNIVYYDPGSDPVYYNYLAEQIIVENNIKVIFGCYRSSARIAVKQVVERYNALLFYPAQYEGFEYSKNIIYGGAVANQNCVQMADFISKKPSPRIFVVGSDYIWPRESARTMSELISGRGGETIGEAFFKLTAQQGNFEPLVEQLRAARPDAIFCNLVGPSIGHFYRAYAEAGLDPATMPIASLTTSETDVRAMGVTPAIGHLTASPYFQSVDNAVNHATVARFAEWIGEPFVTNMVWEAAYSQVHMAANAIARAGATQAEALREALFASTFDAPQGRIRLDAETGHTFLWPRIGRVRDDGQFDILEEAKEAVRPDPYLTSYGSTLGVEQHAQ
jgi:ABC-type branched-subunit amino acid transport system substrate-binding protein